MKHLFIPYELAILAKEKGFEQNDCFGSWMGYEKNKPNLNIRGNFLDNGWEVFCKAPTHQQLVDWFREKHKKHIKPTRDGGWWGFTMHDLSDEDNSSPESQHNIVRLITGDDYYDTFNRALEEAFKLI